MSKKQVSQVTQDEQTPLSSDMNALFEQQFAEHSQAMQALAAKNALEEYARTTDDTVEVALNNIRESKLWPAIRGLPFHELIDVFVNRQLMISTDEKHRLSRGSGVFQPSNRRPRTDMAQLRRAVLDALQAEKTFYGGKGELCDLLKKAGIQTHSGALLRALQQLKKDAMVEMVGEKRHALYKLTKAGYEA